MINVGVGVKEIGETPFTAVIVRYTQKGKATAVSLANQKMTLDSFASGCLVRGQSGFCSAQIPAQMNDPCWALT